MKSRLILFTTAMFTAGVAIAQPLDTDSTRYKVKSIHEWSPEHRWGDAGAGLGIDYGGLIGVKVTFYPMNYMGIFAAGGWEFFAFAWNVGVFGRFVPANRGHAARPYLKVMYGVNGVTKVSGMTSYDKIFYGWTVGAGLETRFGKKRKSGINLDLNVPFRTPDFFNQVNTMKSDPDVTNVSSIIPITISVGYVIEY